MFRLSTVEPDSFSSENEDRSIKLATVENRQKAVEIDVNTPLSVLDLPSFDSDDLLPQSKANQRTIDMSASKQVSAFIEILFFTWCRKSTLKNFNIAVHVDFLNRALHKRYAKLFGEIRNLK